MILVQEERAELFLTGRVKLLLTDFSILNQGESFLLDLEIGFIRG